MAKTESDGLEVPIDSRRKISDLSAACPPPEEAGRRRRIKSTLFHKI